MPLGNLFLCARAVLTSWSGEGGTLQVGATQQRADHCRRVDCKPPKGKLAQTQVGPLEKSIQNMQKYFFTTE